MRDSTTLGFTITGVLVGAALMGLLALVFSKTMIDSKNAQTGVQNSIDFDTMRNSVLHVITKSELCKDAFFAKDGTSRARLNPDSPPDDDLLVHFINVKGSRIVSKNQNLGGGLVIKKIEFQNVTRRSPGSPVFDAFLYLEGKRSTGGIGGEIISNSRNMPLLSITTNPANDEIIDCGSSGSANFGACYTKEVLSTGDPLHTVCCDGGEFLMSMSTPNDNNNALGVGIPDESCGSAYMVEPGNKIRLKCCK